MEYEVGCMVCGGELVYSPIDKTLACFYCGTPRATNAACVKGHYVCDACHSGTANDIIEHYCVSTPSVSPLSSAMAMMKHPAVKMHGPEHHFLVPAVLLAAFYNRVQPGIEEEKRKKIHEARKRAEVVKGGFCGLWGACGAGIGSGIFISLVTNSTPLSKTEWNLSNRMTAESLRVIAQNGGPRCCKRCSFLAIGKAIEFAEKELKVALPVDQRIVCDFTSLNKECLKKGCIFYKA
jgi:hypothetical protein